jgi:hypothetical protein
VFYSLFMLPLHLTITVWPVICAQALIAAYVLHLVCRTLLPRLPLAAFVAGVAVLAGATWLPFLVSELMPDLFTPLLILVLTVVIGSPDRVDTAERLALAALASFMIATQQSSVPLSILLIAALIPLARWRGRLQRSTVALAVMAPALAMLALCGVNQAAHGRFAVSPFGNVFLLARVIYDGPGLTALRRDCPAAGWRLCPFAGRLPATSDDFLWAPDSPLNLAGGPKAVSGDADAIIAAGVRADPAGEVRAMLANTFTQIQRFDSGDGLEPWSRQVSPWIQRDFPPREQAAYAAARQQQGVLMLPARLAALHKLVSLVGTAACLRLLPLAVRRRSRCVGMLVAVLLAVPLSAAITGALSAPHDRYQSRIMWLPPFLAAVAAASLRRDARAMNRALTRSG